MNSHWIDACSKYSFRTNLGLSNILSNIELEKEEKHQVQGCEELYNLPKPGHPGK